MSEATDGVPSTVPQGTLEVRSREAGTKAPQCASFPSSSSGRLALRSDAKGLPLSADSGAYVASAPKGISKSFSCKFRAKHYIGLITFAARQRIKHHSVLCSSDLRVLGSLFAAKLRDHP